jgi:hypothetical protein
VTDLDAAALLAQYQGDPTTDIRVGLIALVAEVRGLRARAARAEGDLKVIAAIGPAEFDRALRARCEAAEVQLEDIAYALGVSADPDPDLVAIVEELVDWLPEYTLGDGTGDEANVRERAEYAADDLKRLSYARSAFAGLREAASGCGNKPCILHLGPYVGVHTNGGCNCRQRIADALADPALAVNHDARVRREALQDAAAICRRGAWAGKEGTSWRLDCAEEIEELADAPPKKEKP